MRSWAAFAMFIMASCTPAERPEPPTRAATSFEALPLTHTFTSPAPVSAPTLSNSDFARDFLDLSFQMESGKAIPMLTRFEGPIRVDVRGEVSAQMTRDLTALLDRIRKEASIDISLSTDGPAQIVVEAIPQATLQRAVPRAACFVVPRIDNWQDFIDAQHSDRVDWTSLKSREKAVIFVPSDAAPQEVRDCLHEELAQALGPLNDLYRLQNSVFNDDNIHAVLTGFDMLVLRTYYAPELSNGMSREQVAEQLPSLLSRINPAGNGRTNTSEPDTSRNWIRAMETALSGNNSASRRRAAADQAISIGRQMNWGGAREGFAYYAFGRLQVGNDPDLALQAFSAADAIYAQSPDMAIHSAHIAVQLAAFALSAGNAQEVMRLADSALPVAEDHQNAALMATLLMFKAEALDIMGNSPAAEQVRLDSLGWARYGFGSDPLVAARLQEIRALRPF